MECSETAQPIAWHNTHGPSCRFDHLQLGPIHSKSPTHNMGAAQSIPVVGEVLTVADSTARFVGAAVCAKVGQCGTADKLMLGRARVIAG